MPSSTSSSNERIPEIRYGRMWSYSIALFLAVFLSGEVAFRVIGYRPAIREDKDTWAQRRRRIDALPSSKHLLLLGSSRSRTNFSPQVFHERLPDWKLTSLGVDGAHCFETLRDIAENTDFAGSVLLFVTLSEDQLRPTDRQKEYVDHYHANYEHWWLWNSSLNRTLKTLIQQSFVLGYPPINSLKRTLSFGTFAPRSTRSTEDGFTVNRLNEQPAPFIQQVLARIERKHKSLGALEHLSLSEMKILVAPYVPLLDRIKNRGGRVAIVCSPVSGNLQAISQAQFPKETFWDALLTYTNVHSGVHSDDLDTSKTLTCLDESHLTVTDASIYTGELLSTLKRRQFFRASPLPSPSMVRSSR